MFFIKLNTKLLISMTYHSQTNDSSKRINQIVEIVIRYFVIEFSNIDYILTFFAIQSQLNNTFNIATNLSFNETSLPVNFFKKIPCRASGLGLNLIRLRRSISRNCFAISAISHLNSICTRQVKHTNEGSF